MADDISTGASMIDADWDDDPVRRARQIDDLMSGPPAEHPAIIVFGDDAVFGIRPIQRQA